MTSSKLKTSAFYARLPSGFFLHAGEVSIVPLPFLFAVTNHIFLPISWLYKRLQTFCRGM
jgi:hypothetical protein